MKVPYIDLGAQWLEIEEEALHEISKILRGGKSIGDPVIELLENEIEEYLGVKNCITLNSGTDALLIGLKCLGINRGDEVITVANSFIASTAAIAHIGAIPRFVDVGEDHLINPDLIEASITNKSKAIMPVHLEGKMCNMTKIMEIAKKHDLKVIEDAAQSFGSTFAGHHPGSQSDLACFSFHPLKNLNGAGDGGFIATNDADLATRVKLIRNHGLTDRDTSIEFGFVSRLDSLQAAILRLRLNRVSNVIKMRQKIAAIYDSSFENSNIKSPKVHVDSIHTYHLYVIEIENRNMVQMKLESLGIQTKVHYPKLICDQPAFINRYGECIEELANTRAQANRILSIPVHQNLENNQIEYVVQNLLDLSNSII